MKDSLKNPKKTNKKHSRIHVFDTVIILLLLNIVAVTLVVLYFHRINSYRLPVLDHSLLNISSIPLTKDLSAINASAEAYVVFDSNTRTIIAGKNDSLRFSPASTAKVMSAILVLEHYNLESYLKVPQTVHSVLGSKMNLVAGEEIRVRDLLYGMMLPSGNDAAYTLSYYYPGGVEGFVNAMNNKAQELQLLNTHFVDPAGYEDGNFTTASELARLGAHAMQNKEFAQIVKTRFIEVADRTLAHPYALSNLNELLVYDNVLGIKTGFTNEAGGVLLTAVKRGDSVFIVSVLKSLNRFADTKDLMNFINEKIEYSAPLKN